MVRCDRSTKICNKVFVSFNSCNKWRSKYWLLVCVLSGLLIQLFRLLLFVYNDGKNISSSNTMSLWYTSHYVMIVRGNHQNDLEIMTTSFNRKGNILIQRIRGWRFSGTVQQNGCTSPKFFILKLRWKYFWKIKFGKCGTTSAIILRFLSFPLSLAGGGGRIKCFE